jgi:hypothetical protein
MHFRFTHLSLLKKTFTHVRLSKLWEVMVALHLQCFLPLAGLKLHSRWCLLQCHGTGCDGEGYDGNGDAACVRLGSSGQSSATLVIIGSGLVIKLSWYYSSTNVVGTPVPPYIEYQICLVVLEN